MLVCVCVYVCESHFVYSKKIIGMKKKMKLRDSCSVILRQTLQIPLHLWCRWRFTAVAEVIRMFTYENIIRNLTHDLTLKQTLKTITGSR